MDQKPTYEELEQRIKELNREIATHERTESERLSHLRFLTIMDQVDQVIRSSDDIGKIMKDVLETVLAIFQCDRAWLMYPCDPESDFWRVPMECTRPEYPGAFALNQDIPMTSEMVESFKAVLKSKGPLVFHAEYGLPLPDSAKQFSIQSSMNSALYPKVGKPWMLGLSQCSYARQWTEAEISIFQEIGRRISDSLSTLLTLQNLKESEEKYRYLVENANSIILRMDVDGNVTFFNEFAQRFFGYTEKEILGRNVVGTIVPETESTGRDLRAMIEDIGRNPDRYVTNENENMCHDGTRVWIAWTNKPIYDETGAIFEVLCVGNDITDRKRAEQAKESLHAKLQRSQKMESLGLLAGGVAHDLNNVLSGIVSYPELLLLDLPEDSKLRKPIETMQESGHRAAAIVQDLLTVARGVATTKEPLNLNDLATDYLNLPEFKKLNKFHPAVTIKTNLDSNLLNISGSHVHIRKVIMNLVSNAAEAIDESGNVTLLTANRYVDKPLKGYEDVTVGEYAVLAVSDNGSGILSGDLERIFEPFYTKKVMGRSGTGLGLAVVWNVVQDHEGYIDVKSDENGTTFELYFPITRDGVSDKDLSVPIKDYQGNGETILVVDDVESQREIACNMLDKLGYKATAVSSGEEAVEYLQKKAVDLILLDMIMEPGLNGRETYERIIEIHPQQKAVIVSGFAETDEVKKAQKLGAGQYLKKPLTLEKMGIAIRDELKK